MIVSTATPDAETSPNREVSVIPADHEAPMPRPLAALTAYAVVLATVAGAARLTPPHPRAVHRAMYVPAALDVDPVGDAERSAYVTATLARQAVEEADRQAVATYLADVAARNTARPSPSVTTVRDSGQACPADIAEAIRAAFGDAGEWAVGIAWRESRCQPDARNPSGASCLFQLMLPLHADLFDGPWTDPAACIAAAVKLYRGCGRGPWTPPYSCQH